MQPDAGNRLIQKKLIVFLVELEHAVSSLNPTRISRTKFDYIVDANKKIFEIMPDYIKHFNLSDLTTLISLFPENTPSTNQSVNCFRDECLIRQAELLKEEKQNQIKKMKQRHLNASLRDLKEYYGFDHLTEPRLSYIKNIVDAVTNAAWENHGDLAAIKKLCISLITEIVSSRENRFDSFNERYYLTDDYLLDLENTLNLLILPNYDLPNNSVYFPALLKTTFHEVTTNALPFKDLFIPVDKNGTNTEKFHTLMDSWIQFIRDFSETDTAKFQQSFNVFCRIAATPTKGVSLFFTSSLINMHTKNMEAITCYLEKHSDTCKKLFPDHSLASKEAIRSHIETLIKPMPAATFKATPHN